MSMEPMSYRGPCKAHPRGEEIVERDQVNRTICVIMSGWCFATDKDAEKPTKLEAGDYFGEHSALEMGHGDGKLSTRTVWARGAAEEYNDPENADRMEWSDNTETTETVVQTLSVAALFKYHEELKPKMTRNVKIKDKRDKRFSVEKRTAKRTTDDTVDALASKVAALDRTVGDMNKTVGDINKQLEKLVLLSQKKLPLPAPAPAPKDRGGK